MSSIWIAGQGLGQAEESIDYPRPDRLVKEQSKRLTECLSTSQYGLRNLAM